MSQKRHQEAKARLEGDGSLGEKRRRPSFKTVVQEVMRRQSVKGLLEPVLEPLIRRVVKEEVELALQKHLSSIKWNTDEEMQSSEIRSLELKFLNKLSFPVFTSARVEGEAGSTLKIALTESPTGEVVKYGFESSAKVEIVVLEGDFDPGDGDNWTAEEFKNNIVREREGKKSLLSGDIFLTLREGIGGLGEVSFTDNSSWTRSRKFRLGARVVSNSGGTRVKEAKTDSFVVRDHRGELYKKHHPPSLADEVWRLEKIGKDGAFHKRLTQKNINTVQDFLTQFCIDPLRLRHILGTGMSAKMWEVTVDHAHKCKLDKRVYMYRPKGPQQHSWVVFNVVGQLLGLLKEYLYIPIDDLTEIEKEEARKLVLSALEYSDEVITVDDETSLSGGYSNFLTNDLVFGSPLPRTEVSSESYALSSYKMGGFDYSQASASDPGIISSIYGFDEYALADTDDMDLRYEQQMRYPGQGFCETEEEMAQVFSIDDHMQFLNSDAQSISVGLESRPEGGIAVENILLPRARTVDKAQRGWTKLFSVLKWFSIRKIVASKKTHVREIQRYNTST